MLFWFCSYQIDLSSRSMVDELKVLICTKHAQGNDKISVKAKKFEQKNML